MAITKNTAKAAEKPVAAKSTKEPVAKVEASEPVVISRAGRRELAAHIRESVAATGGAISEKMADVVVVAYEEAIASCLAAGTEVVLPGFGKFVTTFREARQGHNPQTGEAVQIAARVVPAFKAGTKLKALVNEAGE